MRKTRSPSCNGKGSFSVGVVVGEGAGTGAGCSLIATFRSLSIQQVTPGRRRRIGHVLLRLIRHLTPAEGAKASHQLPPPLLVKEALVLAATLAGFSQALEVFAAERYGEALLILGTGGPASSAAPLEHGDFLQRRVSAPETA
jgi:hypothetical protein